MSDQRNLLDRVTAALIKPMDAATAHRERLRLLRRLGGPILLLLVLLLAALAGLYVWAAGEGHTPPAGFASAFAVVALVAAVLAVVRYARREPVRVRAAQFVLFGLLAGGVFLLATVGLAALGVVEAPRGGPWRLVSRGLSGLVLLIIATLNLLTLRAGACPATEDEHGSPVG